MWSSGAGTWSEPSRLDRPGSSLQVFDVCLFPTDLEAPRLPPELTYHHQLTPVAILSLSVLCRSQPLTSGTLPTCPPSDLKPWILSTPLPGPPGAGGPGTEASGLAVGSAAQLLGCSRFRGASGVPRYRASPAT